MVEQILGSFALVFLNIYVQCTNQQHEFPGLNDEVLFTDYLTVIIFWALGYAITYHIFGLVKDMYITYKLKSDNKRNERILDKNENPNS